MENLNGLQKFKRSAVAVLFLIICGALGNFPAVFAHGGEDHGESKAKTTADAKGIVSHTARLGDLEIMVKHTVIEPDQAAAASLFITDFKTNSPADKTNPAVEVESSGGTITSVTVEKNESSAGSYNLKIPPLPVGVYTLRAGVTYAGETDTAIFSGVSVETTVVDAQTGTASPGRTALIVLLTVVISGLFGGLIYNSVRAPRGIQTSKQAVSV